MNTTKLASLVAACAVFIPSLPAETIRGVDLELVNVASGSNAADTTTIKTAGAGDVAYPYAIGKYEVTAEQWKTFLNLVDPTGTNARGLFTLNMENNNVNFMRINNNGTVNGQRYAVTGNPLHPVVHVNWQMAARFCNYLTSGDTEQGPYVTASGTAVWTVNRAAAQATYPAVYVLPTLDEWYKAAYHKGTGLTGADYWDFPIQADVISETMANYGNILARTTDVGAFNNPSAYGTYDQGGNVREWLETQFDATRYMYRGGSWDRPNSSELGANGSGYQVPTGAGTNLGIRIARIGSPAGFILPTPVHQSVFVEASSGTFNPRPAFCTPVTDPQTGYVLARMGGTNSEMTTTFAMPAGSSWDSDHGKHWYNTMPAVNCNDTLAISNARKGVAAVWDVQTMKHLGWAKAVGSTSEPESSGPQRQVLWDKLDPLKYYFCSQNRIMSGTITRLPGPPATISTVVAQVYQFTGYDMVSFGDTKGDLSRDNKRTTMVGKKNGVTNAVTVIAFQLDTLTIAGTRDIADTWNVGDKVNRWDDFDGAMVDPTGQYIVYDSGAAGIFSLPWDSVGNASVPWTHVTTATRHGELVVGPDGVTPYWVRNSNMNGIRRHVLSTVNNDGESVWTVGGSDGHMSGIDGWPGKFTFSRYKDGGIYLFDMANPGYSYYLGNSRHYKKDAVGEPWDYGHQPKASMSATGRSIMFISDNGSNASNISYVYLLKMPQ